MRHSTITLTMDRYTHVFRSDETAAIAKLPDLRPEPRDAQRSSGTDVKAGCVAGYRGGTEVDQGDTSVDSRTDRAGAENRDQTPVAQEKAAFEAAGGKRPRWDSNPRITDLQSVPLVHLGTRPVPQKAYCADRLAATDGEAILSSSDLSAPAVLSRRVLRRGDGRGARLGRP